MKSARYLHLPRGWLAVAAALAASLARPAHGQVACARNDTLIWNVEDVAAVSPLEDFADQREVWDSLDASDSPRGAVRRLLGAYAHGWSREYRLVLSADFCFEFGEAGLIIQHPMGFTAEDERLSLRHLARGFVNREGVQMPPARAMHLMATGWTVSADPAHLDDPARFQVVLIEHALLQTMIGDGDVFPIFDGMQRLALVRGDAAWLEAGQPADADHWYVRSWIENPVLSPPAGNTWGVIYR